MKKLTALAASAAILGAFVATTANATQNPFGMQNVTVSTQVAMSDGKCGDKDKEGKCGDKKTGKKEGKCGEGKCGAKK
jgi:uncharacterized low-complexity protein